MLDHPLDDGGCRAVRDTSASRAYRSEELDRLHRRAGHRATTGGPVGDIRAASEGASSAPDSLRIDDRCNTPPAAAGAAGAGTDVGGEVAGAADGNDCVAAARIAAGGGMDKFPPGRRRWSQGRRSRRETSPKRLPHNAVGAVLAKFAPATGASESSSASSAADPAPGPLRNQVEDLRSERGRARHSPTHILGEDRGRLQHQVTFADRPRASRLVDSTAVAPCPEALHQLRGQAGGAPQP